MIQFSDPFFFHIHAHIYTILIDQSAESYLLSVIQFSDPFFFHFHAHVYTHRPLSSVPPWADPLGPPDPPSQII